MPVEIKNLYLYPAKSVFQDGFYLYDRNLYNTYSDIMGDVCYETRGFRPSVLEEHKYIKIYAKQNLDLYHNIRRKVASLAGSKEPVRVSIKGKVKAIESNPQDYPYNPLGIKLSIMLESIIYDEE